MTTDNSTATPSFRLAGPDDIAQLAPHLIGFDPEESLVLMVTEGTTLIVTARVDLSEVADRGNLQRLVDQIWSRFPDANAYLIAYTADHQLGWQVLEDTNDAMPAFSVIGKMVVNGTTWMSQDGEVGQVNPVGEVAAGVAELGLGKRASRHELEAIFAPADPDDKFEDLKATITAAFDQPLNQQLALDSAAELMSAHLADPAAMTRHDAIQLAVLSELEYVRNTVTAAMMKANVKAQFDLWRTVVNHLPATGAGYPAYLAGLAAWIDGDGAMLNIAIDRSFADTSIPARRHPAIHLAGLVDAVVPPTEWDQSRAELVGSLSANQRFASHSIASASLAPTT